VGALRTLDKEGNRGMTDTPRHHGWPFLPVLRAALALVLVPMCWTSAAPLAGFYPLDGNGIDPTATGPALTQPGGAVAYVPGLAGQAASFDGSGATWLRAAINASGDVNPTFSWGTWVKLNNPAAWNIFLSNDNGGWDRFTQANGGRWSVSWGGVRQSPLPTSTNWTFIAHTFDGLYQHLHVDDLPVFDQPDPAQASQPFIDIGRNANGAYPLNGLMDGVFFFDRALTADEVATIRDGGPGGAGVLAVASAPEPALSDRSKLVSVDLQAAGSINTFSGVEPTAAAASASFNNANAWNPLQVPHWGTVTPAQSFSSLVDADGNPTPVGFSVTGPLSAYNNNYGNVDSIREDYFLFGGGVPNVTTTLEWAITGLAPGGAYELYVYGAQVGTADRSFQMLVDTDGDGSLVGELIQTVDAAGQLFSSITAGPGGEIMGQALRPTGEGNWGGWQLYETGAPMIPEPTSLALLGLGALALARRRRSA